VNNLYYIICTSHSVPSPLEKTSEFNTARRYSRTRSPRCRFKRGVRSFVRNTVRLLIATKRARTTSYTSCSTCRVIIIAAKSASLFFLLVRRAYILRTFTHTKTSRATGVSRRTTASKKTTGWRGGRINSVFFFRLSMTSLYTYLLLT